MHLPDNCDLFVIVLCQLGIPMFVQYVNMCQHRRFHAGGTPVSPGVTPTDGQKGRRPSYFARPQIRAAPQPAAPAETAAAASASMANGSSQVAAPAVEAAPAKKELPPLLRARLAKRGILVRHLTGRRFFWRIVAVLC